MDAKKLKDACVDWIRAFFEENGKDCNAVVGISGGKDSSVVAALCAEALGRERVIGVLMPCGVQPDIDMARKLVEHLQIRNIEVNVGEAVSAVTNAIETGFLVESENNSVERTPISVQTKTNLPPRIRMAALYAVSQSVNGRVANTCNL